MRLQGKALRFLKQVSQGNGRAACAAWGAAAAPPPHALCNCGQCGPEPGEGIGKADGTDCRRRGEMRPDDFYPGAPISVRIR